jgi:GTP-binding protein EngB required for normal cell division
MRSPDTVSRNIDFRRDKSYRINIVSMAEEYLIVTGRPNAGKSSLIKKLAGIDVVTGKYAGTTRNIKRYPLKDGLILVDMPGFGKMMGASKRLENMMNNRIIKFVESKSQKITLAIHVLDITQFIETTRRLERKGIISVDIEMVHFLAKTLGEFPLVAANKIDKVDKTEMEKNLQEFLLRIKNENANAVNRHVFPVSTKTGEGVSNLKNIIHQKLVARGYRTPFKVP